MPTCLHIFDRDLRLADNDALNEAATTHDIVPAYLIDEDRVDGTGHYNPNASTFLKETLHSLDEALHRHGGSLRVLHGDAKEALSQAIKHASVDAVSYTRDHTPRGTQRANTIQRAAEQAGVDIIEGSDQYLTTPGSVTTNKGTTYKVFSYFEKTAKEQDVPRPTEKVERFTDRDIGSSVDILDDVLPEQTAEDLLVHGGRDNAEQRLQTIAGLAGYNEQREIPAEDGTTRLSPYLTRGVISPREAYWAVRDEHGESHGIISELYWRDFYGHLLDAHPGLLDENMKDKYDAVEWRDDPDGLQKWKNGRTGFPIVDAAMRQLTQTGWMHNRCRMIVASFLCKDLRIHWKEGEAFFAEHLVDYDPASNNGGWQWAASTGADSQPYFRIFSPWRQQEKHDPGCEYIKRFLPELRSLDADTIHGLEDNDVPSEVDYPEAMLDHREAADTTQDVFKRAAQD